MKKQLESSSVDEVFKVSFAHGRLQLLPMRTRNAAILPPARVVNELLG